MEPTYKDANEALKKLKDINNTGESGAAITRKGSLKEGDDGIARDFANDVVNIRNKIFHALKKVDFAKLGGVIKELSSIHNQYGTEIEEFLIKDDKKNKNEIAGYNKAYNDLLHLCTRVTQYLDSKGNVKSDKMVSLLGFIANEKDTPDKDLVKFLIEKDAPQMGGLPLKAMMIGSEYKIGGVDALNYCEKNKIDLSFKTVDFSRTLHTDSIASNLIKSGILTDKSLTQLLANRKTTVIDVKSLPKKVSENQFSIMLKSGKLTPEAVSELIDRDNLSKHFENNTNDIKYLKTDHLNKLLEKNLLSPKSIENILSDKKFNHYQLSGNNERSYDLKSETAVALLKQDAVEEKLFDKVFKIEFKGREGLKIGSAKDIEKLRPQLLTKLVERGFVTIECLAELAESGRYTKQGMITKENMNQFKVGDKKNRADNNRKIFRNGLIGDTALKILVQGENKLMRINDFNDLPKNLSMAQARILFENNILEAEILSKVIDKLEKDKVQVGFTKLPEDLNFDQLDVLVKRDVLLNKGSEKATPNVAFTNLIRSKFNIFTKNISKIDSEMLGKLVPILDTNNVKKLLNYEIPTKAVIDNFDELSSRISLDSAVFYDNIIKDNIVDNLLLMQKM